MRFGFITDTCILINNNFLNICSTRRDFCGFSVDVLHKKDLLNYLPPGQNSHHFANDIFKSILLNENIFTSIQISLKFVPNGPIGNKSALVQVMAWHRADDKPLPEPMARSSLQAGFLKQYPLKYERCTGVCHGADFSSGYAGCRYDNLRCRRRQQSWNHVFSVHRFHWRVPPMCSNVFKRHGSSYCCSIV